VKVKQLIKLLRNYPEAEVVLSSDEEGNSFGRIGSPDVSFGLWPESRVIPSKDIKMVILYPIENVCDLEEMAVEIDKKER